MNNATNQFVVEAKATLEELNRLLLAYEANTQDAELVEEIYTCIHAIHETATTINNTRVVQLTDRFQAVISAVRDSHLTLQAEQTSVFFRAADLINNLLDYTENDQPDTVDITEIIDSLDNLAESANGSTPADEDSTFSPLEAPESEEPEPDTATPARVSYAPSESMIKEANKQLTDPDMSIVVEAFLMEAKDLFDDLEEDLPELASDENQAETCHKCIKQLKGIRSSSGFLSLEQITTLARAIEQLLQGLIDQSVVWRSELHDLLHAGFSQLRECVVQVQSSTLSAVDYDGLMYALDQAIEGHFTPDLLDDLPRFEDSFALEFEEPAEVESGEHTEEEASYYVGPDHPLYSEGMKEIVESFIVETGELFDDLDNKLLDLEENYQDEALVNDIFRAVHTIKGSAGFLSLDQLNQLAHHFEDVLNRLRRGDLTFHSDMLDIMFEAFDLMKVLQKQVVDMELEVINTSGIVAQLQKISEGKFVGGDESPRSKSSPRKQSSESSSDEQTDESSSAKAQKSGGKRTPDRSTETIRVEVERLDSLMNLVGELVLNRNRLVQIIDDVSHALQEHDDMYRTLLDTSSQLDFITTELQTGVMHTRMVQVGRIFNKFPRVVRDLAKDANKKINLVIEGAETELDKSLTEEIGDPLVHLIRNSVDHGVESPEDRASNGKDPQGTIRLSAQHEGNNIVIEIEDDGKGIDPEKLKKKAIEKGLISDKEAAEMSDKEAYNLIFKAGFSTAEKVTKISGRGVGMDVVKTNIAKMNGTISINSELGVGTTITLKLPLTLAINQSLLVRQGSEMFAIPLHSVIEVVSLADQKIASINGREVIRIRERILPLVRIGEVLDIPDSKESEHAYAVVVGLAHHRIGLVTDDLVGQKEIVIKPLGNYLKKVEGIAGSTILGDGHVIMILDVAQLIRSDQERARSHMAELEMA